MERYISEKALIENIAKITDLRKLNTKTIGEAISNTPTADVVEVKHGEWVEYWGNVLGVCTHECSECGEAPLFKRMFDEVLSKYCPNCGAKMDRSDE